MNLSSWIFPFFAGIAILKPFIKRQMTHVYKKPKILKIYTYFF